MAEICALYSGILSVNVRTGLYRRGELKGFTKQLPYAGHQAPFTGTYSKFFCVWTMTSYHMTMTAC